MTDVTDVVDKIVKIIKEQVNLKPGEKYIVLKAKSFILVESDSNIIGALKLFMIHFKHKASITQNMLPNMYDGSAYDITIKTIGRNA